MIAITNKSIYYNEFPVSSLTSLEDAEIINATDIVNFLSEYVELGESVTFKRLFEIASCNIDKFNEIFYSTLGGYSLEPYLQEIENNPTEKYESDYLEIYWHCDRYDDELTLEPSLHGISSKTNERYAMDFVSLNNLKNYNVKINRKIELFDYNKFKDKDKEHMRIFLGEKSPTVFEIYDSIFYEISFFGGPQDKKEKFKELEGSMIDIDHNMSEIKEESDNVTIEDLIEKFDEDNIYLVKYKNFIETVEEDRISNDKNLEKLKNCLLEKLKIYDIIESSESLNNKQLKQYYKKLTNIEYDMQVLYGEDEDINFHNFWETPKCTCPKIDNLEMQGSGKPIFDNKCPIHGK